MSPAGLYPGWVKVRWKWWVRNTWKSTDGWTTVETRRFEGLLVSIPSKLLELEPQLRASLACYLAAQEFVVESDIEKMPSFNSSELRVVVDWALRHSNTSEDVRAAAIQLAPRLNAIQDGFIRALVGDDGILLDVAEHLGVRELVDELSKEVLRVSSVERLQGRNLVISSGGLRLEPRLARQVDQAGE